MVNKKKAWPFGKNQRVPLDCVVPNNWNMNVMTSEEYDTLKRGIEETLDEVGEMSAIWCRPHPERTGCVQIIDGEHRWKIMAELGYVEMDCDVANIGDQRAREMTAQLNYNRGRPDPEKYPEFLGNLIRDFPDVDIDYLADRLPESRDEIEEMLDGIDIDIEDVDVPNDDIMPDSKDASTADVWVKAEFLVAAAAAQIIEQEIARISDTLEGKNLRGRALEFMAVLSGQTPLEDAPPIKRIKATKGKKRKTKVA